MCTSKTTLFVLAMLTGMFLTGTTAAGQTIRYVDDDAALAGNGTSWPTAFKYLQDALTVATAGDEIRVARGAYKPDRGTGDRTSTFQLISGVEVYGGYAGVTEPDPDARDIELYETILSGNIGGTGAADNSRHVVTGSGTDATAILNGFTITGGNAIVDVWPPPLERGGGILNDYGSPTVTNCTFSGNTARQGGGMWNSNSHPNLVNCTFSGNSAEWGGGMYNSNSSPTLTDCTFSDNSVYYGYGWAGGMENYSNSSPTLTNCTFSGNSAPQGGGMSIRGYCSPTLTNCTFSGNLAGSGGGMSINHSTPTLTNCTFAGNAATNGRVLACDSQEHKFPSSVQMTNCILWDGGDEVWINDGSTVSLTYSDVQGGWPGAGNIDAAPLFVDADGPDDIVGTEDDDLYLSPGSPCIDSADDTAVPPDAADLDDDGNTAERTPLDLAGEPRFADDPDTADTGVPDPPNYLEIVDMGAYEFQGVSPPPPRLFVDADATGANNGTSWEDAYNDLQDALDAAAAWPGVVTEIWVAQGTYTPDRGTGNRGATFRLISGVALYGGYAGTTEPDPNERDIELYEAILSGDLNGDDGPDFANNGENSYHVTTGSGTDATAIFDGFTIAAAHTNVGSWSDCGGGMRNVSGSPTVNNCTFAGNSARWGGGMGNYAASPTVANCTFTGNRAFGDTYSAGGGSCNMISSSPTFTNCSFNGNFATYLSGGMHNYRSSSPVLTNCAFNGNTCGGHGGGLGNDGRTGACSPTLINCVFSGNSAASWGGGVWNLDHASPALINCTFTGNSAANVGGAMSSQTESNPTLTNCILRGDYPEEIYEAGGSDSVITYSNVQGGWPGEGNIDADPLFVDPDGPDNISGTEDDDVRLSPGSPCIDAADDTAAPPDGADLDDDGDTAERTPLDLGGEPRFMDDLGTVDTGVPDPPDYAEIVDMGAYEFQGVTPTECPPGTFRLVDAEGDFAGWCLSTSHPDHLDIYVDAVDMDQRFALIQLSKDFTDPPGFGDLITPMLIDFVQIRPDELTANTIYIADESVTNNTGVDWTDYHWILFDGPEAWFDVAASGGFDTSPLAVRDFEEFIDSPVNNKAKRLSAAGGVVPDMTTFFPGDGAGELAIGVDLSGEDSVSFTLKERPTTDAVVYMSVESNADGASIAVSPADIFGAGDGQADFRRYYYTATQATLTAPLEAGGRDFIRWRIDGALQPLGQRTIEMTMSGTCTAVSLHTGLPGDYDQDGDVDQGDFGHFQTCFTGPDQALLSTECDDTDLDKDGDVDLSDFGILQACISGAEIAVDPHCAD